MTEEQIKQLQQTEDRSKSNTRRLEEHDKKLDELEKTYSIMEKMNYRMEKVEQSVDRIDSKLDSQQEKKGLKWDKLIDYLFYAVLAYVLYRLGLKI